MDYFSDRMDCRRFCLCRSGGRTDTCCYMATKLESFDCTGARCFFAIWCFSIAKTRSIKSVRIDQRLV